METLCIQPEPLINVSNTEVNKMGQVFHEARYPFRVVNLLPGPRPIPRFNQDENVSFTVTSCGVRPCEQEPCIRVLRFNLNVRVEILTFSVRRFSLECWRILYLKWLKLRNHFGISGLQGDRQDCEERARTMCSHSF